MPLQLVRSIQGSVYSNGIKHSIQAAQPVEKPKVDRLVQFTELYFPFELPMRPNELCDFFAKAPGGRFWIDVRNDAVPGVFFRCVDKTTGLVDGEIHGASCATR